MKEYKPAAERVFAEREPTEYTLTITGSGINVTFYPHQFEPGSNTPQSLLVAMRDGLRAYGYQAEVTAKTITEELL